MESVIRLAGAVALLLWGTYMVKTAMLRTFGMALRTHLARFLRNRVAGFLSGAVLASLLQSSTASALLVAGLQSEGIVTTAMALSAVLGADLGSALMTRVLSLDLSLASPLLILAGTVLFLRRSSERPGQFGRVLLGLGLILTALQFIFAAAAPIKTEAGALFEAVNQSILLSFAAGVALAGCAFSSLAAVVLTASFASLGILVGTTPLWIVLGANLGSALIAVITTAGGTPTARRAPCGNLIFRTAGALIAAALLALHPRSGEALLAAVGPIGVHILFNAALGAAGLLFIQPVSRLLEKLLPEKTAPEHRNRLAISEENLINPEVAVHRAGKEAKANMAALSALWRRLIPFIQGNPPEGEALLVKEERRDLLLACRSMHLFLSALVQQNLSVSDMTRWQQLQNLNEAIRSASAAASDILDSLMRNKCACHRAFSKEGEAELLALHATVGENLTRIAALLNPTSEAVRVTLRKAVLSASESIAAQELPLISRHMARVASGRAESEETSALHVELLAFMRRFNALITAAI